MGFAIEISGQYGRDWVLWGGQQSDRTGLNKGVSAVLNRTAAEQGHNIRRRTCMQLGGGGPHSCVPRQTERLCVSALLFKTNARCAASAWGAKQQVQVASKEEVPRRLYSATPKKAEPKSNGKMKRKRETNVKLKKIIKQTSHLFTL